MRRDPRTRRLGQARGLENGGGGGGGGAQSLEVRGLHFDQVAKSGKGDPSRNTPISRHASDPPSARVHTGYIDQRAEENEDYLQACSRCVFNFFRLLIHSIVPRNNPTKTRDKNQEQ